MSTQLENPQQTVSAPATRSIYMYRMLDGNKIRWKFEVDNQMIIVKEGPAETQDSAAIQNNSSNSAPRPAGLPPDALAQYKKVLEERGIKYNMTPNGQVVVTEVPNSERMIMQFFDLSAPNPDIPDIVAIREQFKQEYDQAGGAACPACQLNGLQRKYREILKAKIGNVTTSV